MMDKTQIPPPPPSDDSSAPPNPNPNSIKDHFQYLNQLNKLSHKISKPPIRKPLSDNLPLPISIDETQSQPSNPQQPPVYNINKNDFRDVVQKLTGNSNNNNQTLSSSSTATPPPLIHPPKPPSSRLQRIRPPPLQHLSTRPPPLLNPSITALAGGGSSSFFGSQRPVMGQQPLSPLPPLPSVHAAAESPISAYMRYINTSSSPMWTNSLPSPTHFPTVSSPLPFGCLSSPKPLLSPGSLFSAANQFGFQPLSPTLPVPSPRWKSH